MCYLYACAYPLLMRAIKLETELSRDHWLVQPHYNHGTLCHSVSTVMQYHSPYIPHVHVHSCMQCLSHCEENHSTSVALLDANKKYNRFLNIVPCECESCFSLLVIHGMMRCYMHLICTDDDNRVKLKSLSGREDCQHDYINASYVDVSIPLTMCTHQLAILYARYKYSSKLFFNSNLHGEEGACVFYVPIIPAGIRHCKEVCGDSRSVNVHTLHMYMDIDIHVHAVFLASSNVARYHNRKFQAISCL